MWHWIGMKCKNPCKIPANHPTHFTVKTLGFCPRFTVILARFRPNPCSDANLDLVAFPLAF